MTEVVEADQKVQEITSILKDELSLTTFDQVKERKKFIPQSPTLAEFAKKKADPAYASANLIHIEKGEVEVNTLSPRQQEKEGKIK
jgi:hypothetical protein